MAWHNLYLLVGTYDGGHPGGDRPPAGPGRGRHRRHGELAAKSTPTLRSTQTSRWNGSARPEPRARWTRTRGHLRPRQDELTVRARTQVALSAAGDRRLQLLTGPRRRSKWKPPPTAIPRYTPTGPQPRLFVRLAPATGGSAQLVLPPAANLQVILAPVGTPGLLSEPVALPTPAPGTQARLDIAAPVDQAILMLPAEAPSLVCGSLAPG